MAYLDELLGRDEQIVYATRQHWLTLVGNIVTELLLIAVLVAAGVAAQRYLNATTLFGQPSGQVVLLLCLAISLVVLVSAFVDYLRWSSRQFIITDHRVIQIEGVLNKSVSDSSLEKINDLELHQSWFGRIFNYGDIEVLTGSDVGINQMRRLAAPLDFKRALLEAKDNLNRGFGYLDPRDLSAYTEATAAPDIQRTLRSLAELRDQGLLSQEEFETKKRELLSRI
jgi:uncharacterized membrane protein YdbT with pleckstrin-like domain